MKPTEKRIRRHRDALRAIIAWTKDEVRDYSEAGAGLFLMETHEALLTWVLEGRDDVDRVATDYIAEAAKIVGRN